MTFERMILQTVECRTVRIVFPTRYSENQIPDQLMNCVCKHGIVTLFVDADTGVIKNWNGNAACALKYKVTDTGTYDIYNDFGDGVLSVQSYVPSFIPNMWGDYLQFTISAAGVIEEWERYFTEKRIEEYLGGDEC